MLDTGELTTALVQALTDSFLSEGVMVGDGIAPPKAGWGEGTPNTSSGFIPYVVVKTAGATISGQGDVPLCTTAPVRLMVPYSIASYENSRIKADDLSQRARDYLKSLQGPPWTLGDLVFKPAQLFLDAVVGASRDDSVHPKMWSASTNLRASVARIQG